MQNAKSQSFAENAVLSFIEEAVNSLDLVQKSDSDTD